MFLLVGAEDLGMSSFHGMSSVHRDLMDGRGQLPSVGEVVKGSRPSLPWFVVDAAGREIEPVSRYLRDLALGDASALTGRSYGYDLLRWFRGLWAVDVGWEQATEAEMTAMVGWLRTAPNPQRRRSHPNSMPAGVINPQSPQVSPLLLTYHIVTGRLNSGRTARKSVRPQ
ncbi:hypothetical protein ABZ667_41215 [Streptomyces lavendulae]|uniref:hypothetical protein n=1 Tax=Streptomyces lavendulae TaxID=1914 RepID=UPI003407A8A4